MEINYKGSGVRWMGLLTVPSAQFPPMEKVLNTANHRLVMKTQISKTPSLGVYDRWHLTTNYCL